jgi:hypothetical protein
VATQHATLSPDRWKEFSLDQQILMIGNEMNRATKLLEEGERDRLSRSYERVLNLTDLTIAVQTRPGLRREMLRWRDLIAELFVSANPDYEAHCEAFQCLLRFTPVAAEQIPFVLPSRGAGPQGREQGPAQE